MEAIWNANPEVNLLYCFEDGNCFIKLSDAASHKKATGENYKPVARPVNEVENKQTKTTKK